METKSEHIRNYQREFARSPKRKEQILTYQKEISLSGITRAKRFKIKYMYGLTENQYLNILTQQSFSCAVCQKKFEDYSQTQIDHDHLTGKIRGILCKACNRALGQVKDSVTTLKALIEYLEK